MFFNRLSVLNDFIAAVLFFLGGVGKVILVVCHILCIVQVAFCWASDIEDNVTRMQNRREISYAIEEPFS